MFRGDSSNSWYPGQRTTPPQGPFSGGGAGDIVSSLVGKLRQFLGVDSPLTAKDQEEKKPEKAEHNFDAILEAMLSKMVAMNMAASLLGPPPAKKAEEEHAQAQQPAVQQTITPLLKTELEPILKLTSVLEKLVAVLSVQTSQVPAPSMMKPGEDVKEAWPGKKKDEVPTQQAGRPNPSSPFSAGLQHFLGRMFQNQLGPILGKLYGGAKGGGVTPTGPGGGPGTVTPRPPGAPDIFNPWDKGKTQVDDLMTNPRSEQVMSSLSRTVGQFASLFGRFGKPFQAVASFGDHLFRGIEKLKDWNAALHTQDVRFAEFSGAMARVMAEQQVRDIQWSRQRGDARAESARFREEAQSRLRQQMSGIDDTIAKFRNTVVGGLMHGIGGVLEFGANIVGGTTHPTPEQEAADRAQGMAMLNFLEGAQEGWVTRFGRPRRHN